MSVVQVQLPHDGCNIVSRGQHEEYDLPGSLFVHDQGQARLHAHFCGSGEDGKDKYGWQAAVPWVYTTCRCRRVSDNGFCYAFLRPTRDEEDSISQCGRSKGAMVSVAYDKYKFFKCLMHKLWHKIHHTHSQFCFHFVVRDNSCNRMYIYFGIHDELGIINCEFICFICRYDSFVCNSSMSNDVRRNMSASALANMIKAAMSEAGVTSYKAAHAPRGCGVRNAQAAGWVTHSNYMQCFTICVFTTITNFFRFHISGTLHFPSIHLIAEIVSLMLRNNK